MAVDDGPSCAKYISIFGFDYDEYDVIPLQYTDEGLLTVERYKLVLTIPSYASSEWRVNMRVFGAELVVIDTTKGMEGRV